MTQQPQPIDLDAIEARANAATPGPWRADGFTVAGGGAWVADTCDVVDMAHGLADAEFIAAARTDVPALVAEIRRLTAELEQARQRTAHDPIECDHQAEAGQLAEQMRQLRATIAAEIRQYCPDHGTADTCRMDCHCAIADEITRLYTAPAAVSGA